MKPAIVIGAALLWSWSEAAAFVGSFPVCYKGAQYVRIEFVKGFAPVDCAIEGAKLGNYWLLVGAPLGFFAPTCTVYGEGWARIHMDPRNADDSVLGHELRHAFPPQHSHPFFLPFVSSSCE